MSEQQLRLHVSTPGPELTLESIVALRLLAGDGWRGVLPGHEPGRVVLERGPLRCVMASGSLRWLATEGGLLLIDRHVLRILTRWATLADSLDELRQRVEGRDRERTRLEQEARALARRHELATRRALLALQRRVDGA